MEYTKVLTVLALIIGAVGIGVGGYSLYAIQTGVLPDIASLEEDVEDTEDDVEDVEDTVTLIRQPVIRGVWYDCEDAEYSIQLTPQQITNLAVTITVGSGESVYFSFSCRATINNAGDWVQFHLYVDGAEPAGHNVDTLIENQAATTAIVDVSYDHSITLTAGTHVITIYADGNDAAVNKCRTNSLYVHTYV